MLILLTLKASIAPSYRVPNTCWHEIAPTQPATMAPCHSFLSLESKKWSHSPISRKMQACFSVKADNNQARIAIVNTIIWISDPKQTWGGESSYLNWDPPHTITGNIISIWKNIKNYQYFKYMQLPLRKLQ